MRIPIQKLVYGGPVVVDENDPDLNFLNPQRVVTVKDGKKVYEKYSVAVPGGDGNAGGVNTTQFDQSSQPTNPEINLDIPDLSDIESINYYPYYDSLKRVRIKAVIKIRNSSIKGKQVEGVDARIYDPSS
jgi:hypothetical protein